MTLVPLRDTRRRVVIARGVAAVAFVLSALLPSGGKAEPKPSAEMTTAALSKRAATLAQLKAAGWRVFAPPIPYGSVQAHEQGEVYLEMMTDASGKLVRAAAATDGECPIFAHGITGYILQNWRGPPDSRAVLKLALRTR